MVGAKFMFAMALVLVQAVYYKRYMWSPIKTRKLVVNAVH
jgi:ubiquinol-cytochrome c reductase cytochrome c1 subunit